MSRLRSLLGLLMVAGCAEPAAHPRHVVAPVRPHSNVVDAGATDAATVDAGDPLEDAQRRAVAVREGCFAAASRAHAAEARYDRWVDMARGPTCRERYIRHGIYTVSSDSRCEDAVRAAQSSEVRLASASSELLGALRELETLSADAAAYYADETYRLDACAHGRELHPRLVAAFARLDRIDPEIDAVENEIQERAVAARLARWEHEPAHRDEYLVELAMDAGQRMARGVQETSVVRRQLVADDDAALRSSIAAYLDAEAALEQLSDTDDNGAFRRRAHDLAQDGRATVLRLDGDRFDQHDLWTLEHGFDPPFGSPPRLVEAFDELVREYNRR